jgi:DNA-binding winged helix-turn-helix (wHTH) protein
MSNAEAFGRFDAARQGLESPHPITRLESRRFDFSDAVPPPIQQFLPQPASGALAGLSFAFDSFRLLPAQRLLLDGNRPIQIGGRAMDLLTALAGQAGKVLSKQELTKQVWPGITVEEDNLKVQMSALRRALGDRQAGRRFIVTVPLRGYIFVAQVTREDAPCDRMTASL